MQIVYGSLFLRNALLQIRQGLREEKNEVASLEEFSIHQRSLNNLTFRPLLAPRRLCYNFLRATQTRL
jgi:hypothetical protein